jgi:hypothetical protein
MTSSPATDAPTPLHHPRTPSLAIPFALAVTRHDGTMVRRPNSSTGVLLMLTQRVGDYFVCGRPNPEAKARGVLRALIIYIVRVS